MELVAALGFGGSVSHSLLSHPNGQDIIYPLGSTLVIKNVKTEKQVFLHGHTDSVTCVALSPDGKTLASGQKTHIGFKSKIILWDFEEAKASGGQGEAVSRELPEFHNVKVQSLSFSPTGTYLASLGGNDDNMLVVWNVESGHKVAFAPAATESALTVQFYNNTDGMLVTAGYHHIRRWAVDFENDKLDHMEANLGTLRRIFKCLAVSACDSFVFAGTTTGDLLQIALEPRIPHFKQAGKELFRKGIRSVCFIKAAPSGRHELVLGCGDGSVVALDATSLKKLRTGKVMGEATSVSPVRRGPKDAVAQLFVGTDESNIYCCADVASLADSLQLRSSCHYHGINDVAFLDGFNDVFVTCATNDIRVWNAKKQQELLRIQVPNVRCTCLALPRSGDLILSGWDDGKIRAFKPVSGALEFIINDSHPEGVSALAVTKDCQTIISGGQAGAVRFWCMRTRKMLGSLKEHKSAVTSIAVRSDNEECVSSADDGSCIVWDLRKQRRSQAMFAQTMFKAVQYHPDESQFLTCGSDRKLTYWDAYDGSPIRILEGSKHQINALAVDNSGELFVSGCGGCMLKVYSYDEGDLIAQGIGHSGAISAVKISPDHSIITSVGAEGAIFVWKYPSGGLLGGADAEAKTQHK